MRVQAQRSAGLCFLMVCNMQCVWQGCLGRVGWVGVGGGVLMGHGICGSAVYRPHERAQNLPSRIVST